MTRTMETATRIHTVRERVAQWRGEGLKIALVPTTGHLHKGHGSLFSRAHEVADRVIVSVFENPLTAEAPDAATPRRTTEHDSEVVRKAAVDLLFAPTVFEVFPAGYERTTVVDVPELSGILCGAFRPGYYAAMATLVTKLCNVVQPDFVVFGEKDWQQLVIVQRLVLDLSMPMEVVSAPTVRDYDGLAWSAANRMLSRGHRDIAPKLHNALKVARKRLQDGERNWVQVMEDGLHSLVNAGFRPDYFVIRQATDLRPVTDESRDLIIVAAARLGQVRLVDNVRVKL